jgi:hypothetical protein
MSHLVLEIETSQFPTEPEGDLEYCNGMPGSHFANWLREGLLARGIECREILQEDYGWGFWTSVDRLSIWVAVSCSGSATEGATPMWHVMVDHEPGFALWQWFRRRAGLASAARVFKDVSTMIQERVDGKIVHIDAA